MKKILFLIGPHASGKTYSSIEYVNINKECKMIDTGPIMRRIHDQHNKEISIGEWVEQLEIIYGKNITSKIISTEIENIINNSEYDNYILIGFRTLEGIKYVINYLNIEDYSILYVDASLELLYSNYIKRENKKITKEEFSKYLNDELNSGLSELREMALKNDNSIEYYYKTSNNNDLVEQLNYYFKPTKKKILKKEK